MMLETLKRVEGAVSTQDLVPALTHICIYNGRIQGGNGRVAIDTACPFDFNVVVPAEKFIKAVDACKGDPTVKLEGSKLTLKYGRFRASMTVLDNESYMRAEPGKDGSTTATQHLLPAMRRLQPFISTDASRPWACSLLAHQGYLYATNNVVLARVPIKWSAAPLAIPSAAVEEILRIGIEPEEFCVTDAAAWAQYADGSWLKMQLFQDQWPIETLLNLVNRMQSVELSGVPEGLYDDVQVLKPFFPDEKLPIVLTGPEGISTQDGLHSAAVSTATLPNNAFRVESLLLVLSVATRMNLEGSPCPWAGEGIEGFLSVVRV